uniref:Smoothelin domain-containing protein n=1 Tax=Clastoptera arizonana TaxID=38151 RepID=A0A1B6E5K1_9HEMI
MATEVTSDFTNINDEDVLRRMWQQTEDFGTKKEIRARMYKLREQRLREFYTTGEVVNDTVLARKYTGTTHADSISDQGFLTMKTKEIRDSESPTRDIQRRVCDNNYWNLKQESSDNGNTMSDSYSLIMTGQGGTADGKTQLNLAAQEKGYEISSFYEDESTKSAADQKYLSAEVSSNSHTKTDNGETMTSSTVQQRSEQKSSKIVKNEDSHFSSKWETSSTSSKSHKIISSSTCNENVTNMDINKIRSRDDMSVNQFTQDSKNINSHDLISGNDDNIISGKKQQSTTDVEMKNQISSVADNEIRRGDVNVIKHKQLVKNTEENNTNLFSTKLTSDVQGYSGAQIYSKNDTVQPEAEYIFVDQKIMTELQKLDSFLSTQNTGTSTPISPYSVTTSEREFVYKGENKDNTSTTMQHNTPHKQPSSLDLKDSNDGHYVTTYQEHYTNKRISVDHSPTHDAFARSLRQSPPPSSRSSSKTSLDRNSPERRNKPSPRSSPDKERRVSVGSYTIEKFKEPSKQKSSDAISKGVTTKDTTSKRKFSSTQTKMASKTRASTPGASPDTSPVRGRTTSPSSQSDSETSPSKYKKSTTSKTPRRKLEDSFNNDVVKNTLEKSENDRIKNPISGILRKTSKTDVKSDFHNTNSSSIQVTNTSTSPKLTTRLRTTSPEYSSEGSIGKELQATKLREKRIKASPDSSPERSAFTPIKCFRTSPEVVTKQGITSTRKQTTPDSGLQSPASDKTPRRSPSPSKAATKIIKALSPSEGGTEELPNQSEQSNSSMFPEGKSPAIQNISLNNSTLSTNEEKEDFVMSTITEQKNIPRFTEKIQTSIQTVDKTSREVTDSNNETLIAIHRRSPSPGKFTRSYSPLKTTSLVERPTQKNENKTKSSDEISRRTPSPNKNTPSRGITKHGSPDTLSNSPSVSPCSSPERSSVRSSSVVKTARKPSDKEPFYERINRRSSIPRADQTSFVRKTNDSTVDSRPHQISKIPSCVDKQPKSVKSPQTKLSQTRITSQSVTENQPQIKDSKSNIQKLADKHNVVGTTMSSKTVKTTAVITLQKPASTTPMKKITACLISQTRNSNVAKKPTPAKNLNKKRNY